ncbi:hypothetical protein PR202_gn00869 [Eleusine coracana subsp. coracana]|uniref:Uncharacterized protein n=1 Tax=Eleusine coracana subsp. coracana TaxID=191504 RepID=A0AAV5G5C7_ELECO|nr:hypothetical protein PR202_gn00869 [Eleusine coracana subsp. coracana]
MFTLLQYVEAWDIFVYSVQKEHALCWSLTPGSWGSKRSSFWWFGYGPIAANHKKEVSGLTQGTNDCFIFTNVDGCPVIYRPTGNLNGSSSTSETFNNPCLSHTGIQSQGRRAITCPMQLWGFVSASKYEEMLSICRTEKQGIWNL